MSDKETRDAESKAATLLALYEHELIARIAGSILEATPEFQARVSAAVMARVGDTIEAHVNAVVDSVLADRYGGPIRAQVMERAKAAAESKADLIDGVLASRIDGAIRDAVASLSNDQLTSSILDVVKRALSRRG